MSARVRVCLITVYSQQCVVYDVLPGNPENCCAHKNCLNLICHELAGSNGKTPAKHPARKLPSPCGATAHVTDTVGRCLVCARGFLTAARSGGLTRRIATRHGTRCLIKECFCCVQRYEGQPPRPQHLNLGMAAMHGRCCVSTQDVLPKQLLLWSQGSRWILMYVSLGPVQQVYLRQSS